MEKGLLEKTGRSLEDWIKLARKTKLDKYKAILDHLKTEHSLTHGYANLIALKTLGTDAASHDAGELVETQYKGKEILRPIYEGLLKQIGKFGNDITITPKKDSVSIIRKKQFALIKPATKTRIDLGLKLKDKPTTERLGNSGPFGAMCTHRVQLTNPKEIDSELLSWLKEAYEKAN